MTVGTATMKKSSRILPLREYLENMANQPVDTDIDLVTIVQVAGIARYMCDGSQREQPPDKFLYDLYCGGEGIRCKFHLHPDHNKVVQKNQLRKNSVILITNSHLVVHMNVKKFKRKESIDKISKYILIINFEIIRQEKEDMKDVFKLPDHKRWKTSFANFLVPCCGIRTSFVDVWNDALPRWPLQFYYMRDSIKMPLDGDLKEAFELHHANTVFELSQKKTGGLMLKKTPVFARVLGIGKLHHYAKPSDQRSFPYRSNLVVTDGKYVFRISIWDEANMEYHNSVQIGSVLIITEYYPICNASYQRGTVRLSAGNSLLMSLPLELKVNVKGTTQDGCSFSLHVLSPEFAAKFPIQRESFDFFSGFDISTMSDGHIVDVCGLVVGKSRVERSTKRTQTGETNYGFWVIHWMDVLDLHTESIIRLQLFVNGQEWEHETLAVGSAAIFSYVKIMDTSIAYSSSRVSHRYVTTTNETQIIVLSPECREFYEKCDKVSDVLKLLSEKKASLKAKLQDIGRIGGSFFFPPTDPTSVLDLRPSANPVERTQSNLWRAEIEETKFFESKRLLVQAFVTQVYFVNLCMLPDDKDKDCRQTKPKRTLIYKCPNWERYHVEDRIMGLERIHPNTFPHKFDAHKTVPKRPPWFPRTVPRSDLYSSDGFVPLELQDDSELNCDGYYEFVIVDGSGKIGLRCLFMPFPTNQEPPPTLWELVNGSYAWQPYVTDDARMDHYSWKEVERCAESSKEFPSKSHTILLEVFNHGSGGEPEIILRRIFKTGFP